MKKLEQSLKDNPGEKDYTNKFISNVEEYSKKPDVDQNKAAIDFTLLKNMPGR